jgi:hypothetical protein
LIVSVFIGAVSPCCWRRRNHDPSTAIVDNYFEHPSFSIPHFFLAKPSALTATRDSSDSLGANERETFFANHPPPAPQSIAATPADHRPGTTDPPSLANQSSGHPPRFLGCAVSMTGIVLFCLFGVCFVSGGEEQDSILRITMESNPHGIHSLPSKKTTNKTGDQAMVTPSCRH